jgi:hypothetical protein
MKFNELFEASFSSPLLDVNKIKDKCISFLITELKKEGDNEKEIEDVKKQISSSRDIYDIIKVFNIYNVEDDVYKSILQIIFGKKL